MKAQVLYGKEDLRLEEKSIPVIKDNEVLIRIKACGICKSDVDYYFEGRVADFIVKKPIVSGHEASGIIEEVGRVVKDIKIGDRVSIIPLIGCRDCDFCLNGAENLCRNRRFLGCPPDTQGCYQEYIAHPADLVVKINNSVSYEEGAMIEPSSIAYNGIKIIGGVEGENRIGIIGAGTIGLLIGAILNSNKRNEIYFFDIDEKKVNFAVANILNSKGYIVGKDEDSFPKDLNMAFDVSGSSTGINIAIKRMDFGGKISLIGWSLGERSTDLNTVVLKELMLHGSSNFNIKTFKEVAELVNNGKVNLKNLFKSGFKLEDTCRVIIDVKNKKFEKPKVIINI